MKTSSIHFHLFRFILPDAWNYHLIPQKRVFISTLGILMFFLAIDGRRVLFTELRSLNSSVYQDD